MKLSYSSVSSSASVETEALLCFNVKCRMKAVVDRSILGLLNDVGRWRSLLSSHNFYLFLFLPTPSLSLMSSSKDKVNLTLCLAKYEIHHEGVWGSGRIDPYFLDISISWRWVVSFMPRPRYPQYPLDRRLGGPQSRFGQRGEKKTKQFVLRRRIGLFPSNLNSDTFFTALYKYYPFIMLYFFRNHFHFNSINKFWVPTSPKISFLNISLLILLSVPLIWKPGIPQSF
jgi:hypothetical protein